MTVKFVIGHWTGGQLHPNKYDLNAYQLLIDGEAATYRGVAQGCTSSTGGMNSITYNIACCGGLSTSKLTPIQVEKFFKTCAEKIKVYGLTIDKFYRIYTYVKIQVVTEHAEEIREAILEKFYHGITIYTVTGGYTLKEKKVLEIFASQYEMQSYLQEIRKVK